MSEIKPSTALSILCVVFFVALAVGRASLPAIEAASTGSAARPQPAADSAAAPAPAPAPTPAPAPAKPAAKRPAPAPAVARTPAPAASKAPAKPVPAAKSAEQVWRVRLSPDDASIGPKDAPVTVVVFSAFGSVECTDFKGELDRLMSEQPYKSKVKVVFKHKVLPTPHPDAMLAAQAALAAKAQGRFWPYHDKLFQNTFSIDRTSLVGYAKKLGLKVKAFEKDLDSQRFRPQVLRDSLLAYEVGAHSYPNILANGVRIKKPKNYANLKLLVDAQIKRAEAALAGGTPRSGLYDSLIREGKTFPQIGNQRIHVEYDGSPTLGPKTAKVKVVVFEDFQCPFCAKIGPNLKAFQRQHPKDVAVVFKHLPLHSIHPDAQLASEASMAAHDQGKFWQYHDILFRNPKALGRADLETYAQQAGLDMDKFKAALDKGTKKGIVGRDAAEARRAGVSGTPSVYVNGRKYQGPPGYPPEGLEAVAATYFGLGR